MGIKIGCCGFPVKHQEYAARFRLVEVQQTFYQPPLPATARKWRQEMPPNFDFTLKCGLSRIRKSGLFREKTNPPCPSSVR